MRVAVSGASGLLGQHVIRALRHDGHETVRLVRRAPSADDEVHWHPAGHVDRAGLTGTQAVIHLAGAGLGARPWTPSQRRLVRDSRVRGTRTIAAAMAGLEPRPRVLLSASGVGYYGNPGDRVLDETDPAGDTFIARLAQDWERSTAPAADAGIRVVPMRTGVVVSAHGGAFGRLLPVFRLGLGGRLGSGRQWWSWVALTDYVRAVRFLLDREDIAGPVNVCSPEPVTNADLTAAIGHVLHRPAWLPVPGFALRLPFRDFAEDLLGGQRVVPTRLLAAGFTFEHGRFEPALRHELQGRGGSPAHG